MISLPSFQGKQQGDCFETIMSSIHKVALCIETSKRTRALSDSSDKHTCHKDVTCLWYIAALPEELEQVPELPMDITTDGDGTRHGLDVGFFKQDVFHLIAELLDVEFGQM